MLEHLPFDKPEKVKAKMAESLFVMAIAPAVEGIAGGSETPPEPTALAISLFDHKTGTSLMFAIEDRKTLLEVINSLVETADQVLKG